eukprot:TRINITY_DN45771_c0_g1_i1.p1 TRINITY_DN45771_c0_g1~~TRINITY_DN45771_c0_g1_i1.p1  ORF type:complete len:579 (+),score=100.77 TRINITY_DN45771_c0_g1_i1:154-1890(+)
MPAAVQRRQSKKCFVHPCSATSGENWTRLRWAVWVFARWPHLAELEVRPEELLPAARRALDLAPAYGSCVLGEISLRLFVVATMGAEEKVTVLAENAPLFGADLARLLTTGCGPEALLTSGWPIFTLLARLRQSFGIHRGRRTHGSRELRSARPWAERLTRIWAIGPRAGPPEPPLREEVQLAGFASGGQLPRRYAGTLARWRGSHRAPPALRRAASSTSLGRALLQALRALHARPLADLRLERRRWQKALAAVGRELRRFWRAAGNDAEALTLLLRSAWPICEALSFIEEAHADSLQLQDAHRREGHHGHADPRSASAVLAAALAPLLAQRHASAVADPTLRALASVSGSVLPSEAFLLHTLADMAGASILVESGVGRGGSTRAACAWARRGAGLRRVVAIERAQLHPDTLEALSTACAGVRLDVRAGDTFEVLESLLLSLEGGSVAGDPPPAAGGNASGSRHAGGLRVAVFLDGPKGRVAVRLAEHLLRRFPHVALVALHDVPRLDSRYRDVHGRQLARAALESSPYPSVFSDEQWFVDGFARQLDGSAAWFAAQANGSATGSYGPTLGALLRPTL